MTGHGLNSEIRVRGDGQVLVGGGVPVGLTLPVDYYSKVEKQSEITVRGDGKLLVTGGRGPVGPTSLTWSRLIMEWTVEPVFNLDIASGGVYTYTYGTTIYYRLVPATYDPSLDAFYGAFSGGVLSSKICDRGSSL